jgi:hypothetical protein
MVLHNNSPEKVSAVIAIWYSEKYTAFCKFSETTPVLRKDHKKHEIVPAKTLRPKKTFCS